MLDEYIFLKKQNVVLNQERVMVMEEKNRIQILLQGMQNALNTYNAFQRPPSLNVAGMNANFAVVPQPRVYNKTPQGTTFFFSLTNHELKYWLSLDVLVLIQGGLQL